MARAPSLANLANLCVLTHTQPARRVFRRERFFHVGETSRRSQQISEIRFRHRVDSLSLGYLAYTGVQDSKSYYVTIKELNGMGNDAYSKRLRVAGNVVPGSIKRSGTRVDFMLKENDLTLPVSYTGTEAPPDTFKDDSQALADGRFGRDGVFHAKQLQAKCASKYAPQARGHSGRRARQEHVAEPEFRIEWDVELAPSIPLTETIPAPPRHHRLESDQAVWPFCRAPRRHRGIFRREALRHSRR